MLYKVLSWVKMKYWNIEYIIGIGLNILNNIALQVILVNFKHKLINLITININL